MMCFFIACVITTAVVSIWATAVVITAAKNQLMQRQHRQVQYWQDRAMRAEDPGWRE
jgi:threonine/homoserine/homoserine lactone efflux protein